MPMVTTEEIGIAGMNAVAKRNGGASKASIRLKHRARSFL
jgi:hypothetical protein